MLKPKLFDRGDLPQDELVPFTGGDDAHSDGLTESVPATEAGAKWRVAEALLQLRAQVNEVFPKRSKASDGTVGDPAHQSRASDHNPWVVDGGIGVVTAMDITHDPAGGCDAGKVVEALRASRDPRLKYLIYNRRIANSQPVGAAPAWAWRAYTGSNPHNHHCHLSVKPEKALYDSKAPWKPRQATESVEPTDPEREIRLALSALGADADAPSLRQAIVDARDAAEVLLARYEEQLDGTRP